MVGQELMKAEVVEIVRGLMPSADVVRVDVEPKTDSGGDASLAVRIVTQQRPPREETARLVEVVDKFRTWLIAHDDERFPYFRLLSEDEEREVERADS